jgi:type III pantothenate kinase
VLLALDVGNTQTVIGVFDPARPGAQATAAALRPPSELPDLVHHWRIATVAERTADEHAMLLVELLSLVGIDLRQEEAPRRLSGIAVCSSVPSATAALRDMARRWFPVPFVVIEPGVRTGMPIFYDNPRDVGADRIANAVGALDLFEPPIIVVDLGTATTFDVVSAGGEYLGGAITPGVEVSMDALFANAAALRRVELVEPRHVIGKSTVESIQSGVIYGYAGLVDGLCRRIMDEVGAASVIATGGLAGLICTQSAAIQHHEPWLTLHGLRLIFDRNTSPQ